MLSKIRKYLSNEEGQAAAELAVVLPTLLFVTLGGIILSLMMWSKIVVHDSAREAARFEGLNQGPAETKVREVLRDGNLKEANLQNVTVEKTLDDVTVTVEYNQPTILPGIMQMFGMSGNTKLLKSAAVFKLEKP